MEELVPDVLQQILIGLIIKDLIRCKSVCKSWKSFISSSCFINAHMNHNYNKSKLGHTRITKGELVEWSLVGSCNGLVCIISTSYSTLIVANPLTRELKKLKRPKLPAVRHLCWGFGYDSSLRDYKVIVGYTKSKNQTGFQMLTLKSNDWKVIGTVNYVCINSASILCNGALHWVMLNISPKSEKEIILSFDLSREEFKDVPLPGDALYTSCIGQTIRLGTVEECLCIFHYPYYNINIWIMKEYNVKMSWEKMEKACKLTFGGIVHGLRTVKHNNPYEWSLCQYIKWSVYSLHYLDEHTFVESLVSPHVHKIEEKKAGN